MKLVYNFDDEDDRSCLKSLVQDWIIRRKGDIISGMSARVKFNKIYGIDIDHHVYASVLDFLHIIKEVRFYDHNGGDTQYIVGFTGENKE